MRLNESALTALPAFFRHQEIDCTVAYAELLRHLRHPERPYAAYGSFHPDGKLRAALTLTDHGRAILSGDPLEDVAEFANALRLYSPERVEGWSRQAVKKLHCLADKPLTYAADEVMVRVFGGDTSAKVPLKIRAANPQESSDVQAVRTLFNAAQDEHWSFEAMQRYIARLDAPENVWLGFVNNEPVATVGLEVGASYAYLSNLAVREDIRKQGIGRAMLRHAVNHAEASGRQAIGLYYLDNQNSRAMLAGMGAAALTDDYAILWCVD